MFLASKIIETYRESEVEVKEFLFYSVKDSYVS